MSPIKLYIRSSFLVNLEKNRVLAEAFIILRLLFITAISNYKI